MKFLILALMCFLLLTISCKEGIDFRNTLSSGNNGGPVVRIIQAPRNQHFGDDNPVSYEIIRGNNDIDQVRCFINKEESSLCTQHHGTFNVGNLPLGSHELEIVATDVEGLVDQADENWSVYNSIQTQRERVQMASNKSQLDILFVIDNSLSMVPEQRKISQRFSGFIDKIKDLDWRVGITTTDLNLFKQWSDGRLIAMGQGYPDHNSGQGYYYLTPAIDLKEAQKFFSEGIHRQEEGSPKEQGIHVTYRAIARAVAGGSEENLRLTRFFRNNADLAVVVVSDEDESRNGIKNDPDNLISYVKESFGQSKIFQFHSIIAHTWICVNARREGHIYGQKYESLSKKTGGIVGDVCSDDYTGVLSEIGQRMHETHKIHNLKCKPQDIDNDNVIDIEVIAKTPGIEVPGYIINGHRVEFDTDLLNGEYEFIYHCFT